MPSWNLSANKWKHSRLTCQHKCWQCKPSCIVTPTHQPIGKEKKVEDLWLGCWVRILQIASNSGPRGRLDSRVKSPSPTRSWTCHFLPNGTPQMCSKPGIAANQGSGKGRPFHCKFWSKPNPSCFFFLVLIHKLRIPRYVESQWRTQRELLSSIARLVVEVTTANSK